MRRDNSEYGPGRIIAWSIVTTIFFPALILLLGGNLHWIEGWIFGLWLDVMVLSATTYMYLKDPALLKERAQLPGSQNQKPWDKYLLIAIYLTALAWLIILPLDAGRFGWSPPFPLWIKVLGGVALIPALYLIYQATVENTYLSTLVRIQTDRNQRVISIGVYAFVRHPLYLGCLLMMVGAPSLMGSVYGLLVALIGLILVAGRIIGEEKMLTNELEGYAEYKKKVIYRLVPFVW